MRSWGCLVIHRSFPRSLLLIYHHCSERPLPWRARESAWEELWLIFRLGWADLTSKRDQDLRFPTLLAVVTKEHYKVSQGLRGMLGTGKGSSMDTQTRPAGTVV